MTRAELAWLKDVRSRLDRGELADVGPEPVELRS
jgi:hypothetical protein